MSSDKELVIPAALKKRPVCGRYSPNEDGEGCVNLDEITEFKRTCRIYGKDVGYVLSVKCPPRDYPADEGWEEEYQKLKETGLVEE